MHASINIFPAGIHACVLPAKGTEISAVHLRKGKGKKNKKEEKMPQKEAPLTAP
jgi:hypothetical protein